MGDRKSITVKAVAPEDFAPVSAAMARAFEDDPIHEWFFPAFDGRLAKMTAVNEALLPRLAPFDFIEITTTTEHAGCAMWLGPETWEPPTRAMLGAMPKILRIMRLGGVMKMVGAMSTLKKAHPKEPHWYLMGLGTDPVHQRTGVGTALVTPKLEECDRAHLGAYLETQKPENVPYYERFGFRVTGEIDLPKDGPHLWLMWRDPQ